MWNRLTATKPRLIAVCFVAGILGLITAGIVGHLWRDHIGHHQMVDLLNACVARPECKAVLYGVK